ncbi:MAG: hypothetical protein WDN27_01170 [Candidatus Saccharibacteria bacterium]
MSDSSEGATGVTYSVTFTPSTTSWKDLIIDWCNAATGGVIGTTCTAPGGSFTASGVTVGGGAAIGTPTLGTSTAAHTLIEGSTADTSGSPITITLTGIQNSSTVGTFYARLYTYADNTAAATYSTASSLGSDIDTGAVALFTTNAIGVNAYVQESMSFCVSKSAPSGDCGTDNDPDHDGGAAPDPVSTPTVTLGQQIGTSGQYALDAQDLSIGSVYAQLSTNAASGAIVNLKSDATGCGGLYLNGDKSACNIEPQATSGDTIAAGQALFGVTAGSAASAPGAASASGTLEVATGSHYDASKYYMNYVDEDASGVTSTYGDPFLDTGGLPVNNQNITIGLGASVTNTTAAGKYGANLSLIATSTF